MYSNMRQPPPILPPHLNKNYTFLAFKAQYKGTWFLFSKICLLSCDLVQGSVHNNLSMVGGGGIGVMKSRTTHGGGPIDPQ